jgi:subtilisin family serine protease
VKQLGIFFCSLSLLFGTGIARAQSVAPLGKSLERFYATMRDDEVIPVWVYFRDKGEGAQHKLMLPAETYLSPKAIARRERVLQTDRSGVLTIEDIPLERSYVASVAAMVTKVRHEVKWFNAMSVMATKAQIAALRRLPFVREIEMVVRFKPERLWQATSAMDEPPPPPSSGVTPVLNYGSSLNQNQQLNTIALHNQNINGAGVIIAIFDAGFSNLTHPALVTRPIVARYDFQTNSGTLASHSHGQNTFSCVGGFSDGNLIGTAYGASFALARTEVDPTETPKEEDNWARAVIWADSVGADVISSSLGYGSPTGPFDPPWPSYSWQDMNGVNTIVTRAANRATELGIVVVNSAGNDGDAPTGQNSLGGPADGFDVIAVGAVGSTGTRVSFSSVGPTADGRIKPDVMAKGSGTWAATGTSGYGTVSGTSFSCPLTAGVAALVLQANPGLTPKQVAEALRETASRANAPDRYYGWGIANAAKAAHYVWITHTPLTHTADTTARELRATIRSRIPLHADSTRVWYGVNGSITASAPLTRIGTTDEYQAFIPFLGRGVNVTYYIRAKNDSVAVRYPLGTGLLSYQVNNDVTGPTITHTQRGNIAITSWPPRLTAIVSDISRPITVSLEYRRNGVDETPLVLTSADSVYSDTLRIALSVLRANDLIEYRFKAVDAYNNISYAPSTGYYSFRIKNNTHVEQSFEANNGSFTASNDWEYGTPSGTSPAPNSGTKCWGTRLTGNYLQGPRLSSLTTPPYSVYSDRATFSFYHWYETETRYDGANVKVSINGGPFQTVTPVGGYPLASIYSGFSNPLGGQAGYSGVMGTRWQKATFDLTGIATEGNTIQIRFDFGADNNTLVYRGWYIDDFVSDGFGTAGPLGVGEQGDVPLTFALEQNSPNPFNPTTTIKFSIPAGRDGQIPSSQTVSLKVYDVLGREVATLVNEPMAPGRYQITFDAGNLASGTYFYRLQSATSVAVKKLMILK